MNTLIITTFNRPEYLSRCLASVAKLDPMPDNIIITDDGSTDPQTLKLIEDFTAPCIVGKYPHDKSRGIKAQLLEACDMAFAAGADLVINLDADAIVASSLISRLRELHTPDYIVSGFNSLNKDPRGNLRNPIIAEHDKHYLKQHANGINMCFDKVQYNHTIRPALTNPSGNWDYDSKASQGFTIAKPSLVQHIGLQSSMGHNEEPDVAADFIELSLPTVTLFGIDAHDPVGLQRAAEICTRSVAFGDVQIITERLFQGREGYSRFCIEKMASYINTSHVLIIHPDGYIQNPAAWRDEWLTYDYCGACWQYHDGKNVGNGGFSLRSKKLLDILATLDLEGLDVRIEDDFICRQIRPWLEREHGIKFATEDEAKRFSIEAYGCNMVDCAGVQANMYSGQFGFHGYHVTGLPIPIKPKGARHISPQVRALANKGLQSRNQRRFR